MEILLLAISLILLGTISFLIYKIRDIKKPEDNKLFFDYIESLRKEIRETSGENRRETQEKLERLSERFSKGLETSSEVLKDHLHKQLTQSTSIFKDVVGQLTKLEATNKQVLNFSEQMQSLENILKNPKKRGILGEYFLESLLGHVLEPTQYKMQYSFKNGDKVDAAVFMRDKIIPIDAKFSLEKYNLIMEEHDDKRREKLEKDFKLDVKNRIEETSKYIRPDENTTEFALMFIPAEGIYYNLLIYKINENLNINANDLVEYAFGKHVIIVSPTSFFAYLETILQGLNALKMEESIKEVVKKVGQLGQHLKIYDDYMQKLGGHLSTTVGSYNNAYTEFKKVDKDIYKITDGEQGGKLEPILIDKPHIEA